MMCIVDQAYDMITSVLFFEERNPITTRHWPRRRKGGATIARRKIGSDVKGRYFLDRFISSIIKNILRWWEVLMGKKTAITLGQSPIYSMYSSKRILRLKFLDLLR